MSTDLPRHIGFIVDGNRRWAKQHGLPAYEGHLAGYNALQDVLLATLASGVTYASAYVFSTENWKRSSGEVDKLMRLFLKALTKDVQLFIDNNVRLRVVGSRSELSPKLRVAIEDAEARTLDQTGGELLLCLNYGGQREIVDAVKLLAASGADMGEITEVDIEQNLYSPDVPPCDLIVRTSGEQRLSNFMLWRAAYSELLFVDKMWPDMTKSDVSAILEEYNSRKRRFGG